MFPGCHGGDFSALELNFPSEFVADSRVLPPVTRFFILPVLVKTCSDCTFGRIDSKFGPFAVCCDFVALDVHILNRAGGDC